MRVVMRLLSVGAVLLGVVGEAGIARAGFISVLMSAGSDGTSTPTSSGSFQFTNPTGSPQIGISDLVGVSSAQANTTGGSAFFGGLGLPILVNVGDGLAVLSTPNAPTGAVPSTGLSTVAPTAPDAIPTDAAILSASLGGPVGGPQVLSVSVTNSVGSELASGTIAVPAGGWWVLGLSPEAATTPPVDPPVITPPVVDPPVTPPTTPPTAPPTAATPEPTTLALAGLGLPLVAVARRFRRKG